MNSLKSSQVIQNQTIYMDNLSTSSSDDDDDEATNEASHRIASTPVSPVIVDDKFKCTFINDKSKHKCTRDAYIKGDSLCTFHYNRRNGKIATALAQQPPSSSPSTVALVDHIAKTSTTSDIKTSASTSAVSTTGTKIKKSVSSSLMSTVAAAIINPPPSSTPKVDKELSLVVEASRFILPEKLTKVERLLREGPCQSGSIYLFQKERIVSATSGRMLVKIGRTGRKKVQTRIDEWKNSGGLPMNVHTWPVTHNAYAEKVIHLLLSAARVHIDAKDAQGKSKKEIEWFDIELATALKLVANAVAFINKQFPEFL